MAAKAKPHASVHPSVKPGILIAAIAGLILFLGVSAWRSFGPGANAGPASTLTEKQRSDLDWMKQKAIETGGDFYKLNPADQQRLYALHGKMAPFVLKQNANPAANDY